MSQQQQQSTTRPAPAPKKITLDHSMNKTKQPSSRMGMSGSAAKPLSTSTTANAMAGAIKNSKSIGGVVNGNQAKAPSNMKKVLSKSAVSSAPSHKRVMNSVRKTMGY